MPGLSRILQLYVVVPLVGHALASAKTWGPQRLPLLDGSGVDEIGRLLGVAGLALCWYAQRTIAASWRVGIDDDNPTHLVTDGPFRFVQNPTCAGFWSGHPRGMLAGPERLPELRQRKRTPRHSQAEILWRWAGARRSSRLATPMISRSSAMRYHMNAAIQTPYVRQHPPHPQERRHGRSHECQRWVCRSGSARDPVPAIEKTDGVTAGS